MIKGTIKVIHEDHTVSYLYHAGPLRSHTLYGESIDLEKFNFKQQNYEGNYLESEKKRISAFDEVISANIISIEVNSNYKFIKEVKEPSNLMERALGLSAEEICDAFTNDERMKLCTLLLATEHTKPIGDSLKDGCYFGPAVSFVFYECEKYIAVDNRTHDCWVEQFDKEHIAIAWATDPEGDPHYE